MSIKKLQTLSEKILNKFKKTYDLDKIKSVEDVKSLPLDPNCTATTGWGLYYALQRKATQFKKEGNLELAIACLRKSNEISDNAPRTLLLAKDYYRLPNYIKLTGNKELAAQEEANINARHPEFLNRGIIGAKAVRDTIQRALELNQNYIIITSSEHCKKCSKYNNKIYSIREPLGYPLVPPELTRYEGICTEDTMCASIYFDIELKK